MKRVPLIVFVLIAVASGGALLGAARPDVAESGANRPSLRQIAVFELPGPPGKRFDYLTIDEDDNYLLSAHLGAGLLHVIDLRTYAIVKTVAGVPGVEGVAYITESKKIYTANWGEDTIGVLDVSRMTVVKRIP